MPVAPLTHRRSPDHVRDCRTDRVVVSSFQDDEILAWDAFFVEVTEVHTPVVVRCRGGLDFAYADALRTLLSEITERTVIVDLRRLAFIDSTGLSALLTARRAVHDAGGILSIRGANGLVRRVFEVTELADVLDD